MFCHSRFDYKDNREAEETETELKRVVNDQQKQISNLRAQVSCWEAWPAQNLNRVWKYLHKCWWRSRAAIQVLSGIASCTKFAQSLFLHSTKDCTCMDVGAGQWPCGSCTLQYLHNWYWAIWKTFFEYIVNGYCTMFMPKDDPELPLIVNVPSKPILIILYCFDDEPFFFMNAPSILSSLWKLGHFTTMYYSELLWKGK